MTPSGPPVVSMLWETVDPYTALDTRFAFARPEDAASWLRATLAGRWGVAVHRCERIVLSARNALAWLETDAGKLLAKWSVAPGLHPRLAALAELTAWLHGRRLPVSPPLAALDGSLQLATPKGSLGLQTVKAGELLDPGDPAQVKEAGSVLAAFHDALAGYPRAAVVVSCSGASSPYDPGLATGLGICERVTRWLDSGAPGSASRAVAFLRDRLTSFPEANLPGPQLVHNDIRSANILCRGSQVSALLDFEEVTLDHRVCDLAKAAVMLGTRFRNWAPLDLEVQRSFVDGYREFHNLSPSEETSLPVLVVYRTLSRVPGDADPAGWAMAAERLAAQADPFR
jgi:homoserine kinase type II